MREQIRLWFYSQFFMSVALVGRSPYRRVLAYEKMLDEQGREMHASWGNTIPAEDAFSQMGADVMRWQYCAQPPDRNLLFGYGPAREIKRRFLTFWHSVKFLVDYAMIDGFAPIYGKVPDDLRPLDRWLVARTGQLVAEATRAYEDFLAYQVVDAFESYVEDLSNWYIRRSRRRFWDGDRTALATLWWSLVESLRVIAPVAPFVADHLWRNLVPAGAPESVHLAGWPGHGGVDEALLGEVAQVRRVVELGNQARGKAGIKLRQPLKCVAVRASDAVKQFEDEIRDELNVEQVMYTLPANRVSLKPNLPLLGPRLGSKLPGIRAKLEAGEFELPPDGTVVVDGLVLQPEEVLGRERVAVKGDWIFSEDDQTVIALDPTLDDELVLQGRVRELIRRVNQIRKEQGLEITDRIRLTVSAADGDLAEVYGDRIKRDTLAVDLVADGTEIRVVRA